MTDPHPEILLNFEVPASEYSMEKIGSGHINETFLATDKNDPQKKYILQKINKYVFNNADDVCNNSALVLDHIKNKVKEFPDLNYLSIDQYKIKGMNYYKDENSDYWRLTSYIAENTIYETTEDPSISFEAGLIVAKFQFLIHELSNELKITIPGFHDHNKRIGEFESAKSLDAAKRSRTAANEIKVVELWSKKMQEYYNQLTLSGIPERCIHNDTKLNNVLFNNKGKAVCMIDLDTVMPGYIHFDFGDAIRILANTAVEDEPDIHNINLSKSNFKNFCRGYLSLSRKFLSSQEIKLLAFSPLYMTYLIGLRFLTDYLNGDIYFHTKTELHNLIRARNQFAFLHLLEKSSPFLEKTIEKYSDIN